MKQLENLIEKSILATRWLLVAFYLGLGVGLALYAITFFKKLVSYALHINEIGEAEAIIKMLSMIDASLVASLAVMVIIAGYENFVSKLDDEENKHELAWIGKIDAGSLKIKVAATIVAISSIHLLQIFLNANEYSNDKIMWLTVVHMAFVISAVLLAYVEKLGHPAQH